MGDNSYGELGLGPTPGHTNLPAEIISSNVAAVAAANAGYHTLLLESNGSLWAMGLNEFGQLGDGTINDHYVPEQIVSSGVTGIAAGAYHSLFTTIVPGSRFVLPAYDYWAMGLNEYGQLGDGTTMSRSSPEEIQSTELISDIVYWFAGGGLHSIYAREDGSLWATGYNDYGQLGDGTLTSRSTYEKILSSNVVAVSAGWEHSLFLESGGTLWGMGNNADGELGDYSPSVPYTPAQIAINVSAFAAGFDDSFFIQSNGSLWGMGVNTSGGLGNGTTNDQYVPVEIVSSNVVAVAAGVYSTYFIKSDGSLWAMGFNAYGQLGDGTFTDRHVPVEVVPLVIPQPGITNVGLVSTNLILSGTNGESGRTYCTLRGTNLTQPFNQWTPVATNVFPTDGAFTITATNAAVVNTAQAFYVLQAQP